MNDTPSPSQSPETDAPALAEKPSGPEVIKAYLKTLPGKPGVYRMLAKDGSVLYVGKARSLKKRVASYTKYAGHSNRIARMIAATTDMVFITTATETEALLLEANLIKKLKPRYNILLRDDKFFPYIRLRTEHAFPQIMKHRGSRKKDSQYFGPFASAGAVNRTLNALQRVFQLRTCSDSVYDNRTRPCLLYQIKRCAGPCVGKIDEEGYAKLVAQTTDFLRGKSSQIQQNLSERMSHASAAQDYELAAMYRDRIRALTAIQVHQDINPQNTPEADVFAAHTEGGQTCVQVFFFRDGQNWGNRSYFPRHDKSINTDKVLDAFIAQFYADKPVPRLVLASHSLPNQQLLMDALSEKVERKVTVRTPKRGEPRALVDHALTNAKEALGRRLSESASQRKLLEAVAETFDMDRPPRRIEIYDNSHIQGSHAVGGMVVSGPEGLMKNHYRKFNIKDKDLTPGDDYGMMREVLRRRFTRLLKDTSAYNSTDDTTALDSEAAHASDEESNWPDLVLIDGGPGQLSAARDVLADLGIADLCLVSIAKGPERNAGRETFYMPHRPPFTLEPKSPVLYYLQRLRDEAHRFAIGSHRKRRQTDIHTSPLDTVPGIGAKRKKALLHHFGSARAVKDAGLTDLESVDGISKAMAKRIYDHFQDDD